MCPINWLWPRYILLLKRVAWNAALVLVDNQDLFAFRTWAVEPEKFVMVYSFYIYTLFFIEIVQILEC